MRWKAAILSTFALTVAGLAVAPSAAVAQEPASAEEVTLRDQLIANQENLLNTYRCLFGVDTGVVPGGCPDPDVISPGAAPASPTQSDIDVRDGLIQSQEALLNVYRCRFDVDAEVVPGGCEEQAPSQQAPGAVREPPVLPPGACGGSSDDGVVRWVESNSAKDVSWSPDCTRVAFIHHGDLWLMSSGGRSHRLVADDEYAGLLTAAWSPDGSRIAYGRQYEEHGVWVSHIWTVSPDGSAARQLTEGDTRDIWPSWSPDASRIAFSRLVDNDRFIVVMDSDGSRQQPLTKGGRWEQTPTWSPDGARLAYIAGDEVIVANADGTGARAAFGGVSSNGGLSWSPDGSRVAFVRGRGTGTALHVSTLDGADERVVVESDAEVLIPNWSPDGQRIAFHVRGDTAERLYVSGIDSTGFIEAKRTRTIPPAGTAPVEEPPAALGLDPFYTKHIDAALPVVGSSEVSDEALRRAALVFGQIVANRPDIVRVLAQQRVRVAVYAVTENIADLPEVAEAFPDLAPDAYGLAPGAGFPVIALPEENLLCDGYSSVAVHEGGHTVDYALSLLGDNAFRNRLGAAYESAMAAGLWEGTYGATNAAEYWAEGVMWFTNAADEREFTYTWVNTRDELQNYDPVLYELVLDVLGDVEATASCYGERSWALAG